jgi:Fic family protein
MNTLFETLKTARKEKKLLVREVANELKIDQGLISKFEKGSRKPTKEQVIQLALLYSIPVSELLTLWFSERILYELREEEVGYDAVMMAAEQLILYKKENKITIDTDIKKILKEIDAVKKELNKFRKYDSYRIAQALELEYTFESNRIEGNTLTLKETDFVVNEGLTISGKSMKEHLEAINHVDAIEFVKDLVEKNKILSESNILSIHQLILKSIEPAYAGKYRNVQVMIKGSKHMPPQAYLVPKQMEDFLIWYSMNHKKLHPVILAAEMHERLVSIHPFIDGNGRTSRLVMNFILLQHGYVIANIKGDNKNRQAYYHALENVQTNGNKNDFIKFVAQVELDSISRYLSILKG